MGAYFLRRLLLMVPTFLGITFMVFMITRFVPGGPVEQAILKMEMGASGEAGASGGGHAGQGSRIPPDVMAELNRRYGYDKPAPVAYVNWLGDIPLHSLGEKGLEVAVRVRSTREPRPAILRYSEGGAVVELLSAEDGVSPGQACVIYESDATRARVLGGGTIARTQAEAAPAAA